MLLCIAFLVPQAFAFEVNQQFINNNRSYKALVPQGIVIHCTDSPGSTAQNNRDYFNRVYVGASAHYFVDWIGNPVQCIPNTEVAWHAGPYANYRYLSIEMCMPYSHNEHDFYIVYNKTVQLAASLCKQYGWTSNNVFSHKYISDTYHQTDHQDPYAYLAEYGKSMFTLSNDIDKALGATASAPVINQNTSQAPQSNNKQSYTSNAQIRGDWFYVRNSDGSIQQGHRIDNYDKIKVEDVSYSKQLVKVVYPVSSGSREAYIKNSSLIKYSSPYAWKNGSTKEVVYSDIGGTSIGSLDPWEKATILERKNGWTNVVYSTVKGQNTKSGWVRFKGL